jgi:hypothetical protein
LNISPYVVGLNKCSRLRWAGLVEDNTSFKILTDKPTGKRPLARPVRIWEDNIRMDLKETGIYTTNCIDCAQNRDYWSALVNAASTSHIVS